MSHLHTNVIALPASTKSIQWRRYECNYNNSDASGTPLFLYVCRKLLQAKVPCLWRPLGSSDTASQIISLLHMPSNEGLLGESLHNSASDSSKIQGNPQKIQVPDCWEIWLFHAIIPMEQALDLVPIPSSFKAVSSGEISWKSGSRYIEVEDHEGDNSQQPADTIDGIFNRALDNLIDCALLPMSIVRFGLRQWLSLVELPADRDQKQQQQQQQHQQFQSFAVPDNTAMPYSHVSAPQLPLTPPSPELDLPLGITDFVSASALLDSGKCPAPAFSSPYSAPNSFNEIQHPREHEAKDSQPLHLLKLSATLAPSQNTLLLQYNSFRVHGLRSMSYLDTILERRRSNGKQSLATDCIPSSGETPSDSAQLVPIAAVRIAPLGIPATLVSVPTSSLNDIEDKTIDAWSAALGYPKAFFAAKEGDHAYGKSRLVWIRLSKNSEPMLYPQRLVLIDEVMTLMLDSSLRDHSKPEEGAAAIAATSTDKAATEDQVVNSATRSPESMDVDRPSASAENPDDELEEGESKEGEYDEEGEIAESVASVDEPIQPSAEVPLAIAELDTVISRLQPNVPRPLTESLLAIQKSMAKFQSELRVKEEEEEKARKREMAQKNAATAAASTKGSGSFTKSASAKSSSSTTTKKRQRSNTNDKHPNKTRRKSATSATVPPPKSTKSDSSNEDIPLQELVATTSAIPTQGSATQPLTQQTNASAGENAIANDSTNAANGDIGSLFGDTGMGEEGNGGLGDSVANIGEDMGLGMGLGMDMGMGDNLGDFGSGMFGVTDDDFNFFDSVPAQHPKADDPIAMFSHSAMDPASSMDVDAKPQTSFDIEMRSEESRTSTKAQTSANGDTGVVEQRQPIQEMDDMFDDGVFDSFFGGQTTTAASAVANETPAATSLVKQEGIPAASVAVDMYTTRSTTDAESTGITIKTESDSIAANASGRSDNAVSSISVKTSLATQSLSSPPGTVTIVSLSDTHPSAAEAASNTAPSSTTATATAATATMAAYMATPASLRMTPAPSIDLQTPTSTMQSLHNSKGGDSADEHSSALVATADNSPTTLTSNQPGLLPAHGSIAQPSIPEDSEVVYSTGSTSAPSRPPATAAAQSQVVPGSNSSNSKNKGRSWKAPFASSTGLIPERYRFVSTPYDDINKGGRSWLRDTPTPASLGDSSNSQDMMDPHEIQHPAYIEKSLNPVAWLKRVSARHIQKHQMDAAARSRRASASTPSAPRSGFGSLPSIRKLRGWLASYKAKTMYTNRVVPRHVLAYQKMAGEETAESSSDANAMQQQTGAHAKTESVVSDAANGGDDRPVSTRLSLVLGAGETIKPEAVSNLQYPVVRRAGIARNVGGFSEPVPVLKGSGKQQQSHQPVSGLPSFTSIISPRKPRKSSITQMPGSLMPSLSMYDLQNATAGICNAVDAPATAAHLSKQVAVQTNAIESSWVPTWMLVSKGLADTLVGLQDANWLKWADSLHLLTCSIKDPLMLASGRDLVHLADIPEASFLLKALFSSSTAMPDVETMGVSNLGARIGGLLMLGSDSRIKEPKVTADIAGSNKLVGNDQAFGDGDTGKHVQDRAQADAATRCAFNVWLKQLRQDSSWSSTVRMLADWAVGSSLLLCTHSDLLDTQLDETKHKLQDTEDSSSTVGAAVSIALLSFWHQSSPDDRQPAAVHANNDGEGSNTSAKGLLTLSRLLALENTSPSSTSKYSGYIVKKRRTLPQPSGIYSNSGSSSRSSTAVGGNSNSNAVPLASSAVSANTNGTIVSASSSAPAYAGSVVVPSGPGVIEPLLDVRILVGSYGQEDVTVPSSGAISLKSRDAESIYIKRWRYAQKLASRATHDARVASGEIEETEEGEEREDGEDEIADDTQTEPVEDWPDPDGYMMEAEDALRRVCISTNPVSLRWWSQMQMRPVGASKDVRWVAFVPPFFDSSRSRLATSGDGNQQSSPQLPSFGSKSEEVEDVISVETPSHVREWCQNSTDVAQWYLGDVDSSYQAQHLGVHRPLGLQKVLEGTFTQLTESVLPMASGSSADALEWSARLKYEAERLGQCMAHGWYTNSQLEQQRQSQDVVDDAPLSAANGSNGTAGPLSAATLVLYMLVPHSSHIVTWLAMSEASTIALRTFEKTLGSLIARTSHGVPSSTTTINSQVPWPAVVVHPLPLDLLSQWYCGGRPRAVPSAQGTAMSVYNRCPEFLSPVPSLLVASPAPASQFAHTTATAAAVVETNTASANATMPPLSPLQQQNENHHESPAHGVCGRKHEASEFMAAIASYTSGSLAAAQGSMLYQQQHAAAGTAGMTSRQPPSVGGVGGTERQQLVWHSGYFVRTPDHKIGNIAVSNSQGNNNRTNSSNNSSNICMAAFAHRAYIISMPSTFPSYNSEGSKDSVFVPATISLSRMSRQNIVLGDPSALVHDTNGGGCGHQTSMAPVTSLPLGTPQQRSTYPTPPQTRFVLGSAAEEDGQHHSQGHPVTSGGASSLAAPVPGRPDDEVSCELDEVYVSFGCAARSASDPLSSKKKRPTAALGNTPNSLGNRSGNALCSKLTNHPLRPNDKVSTLHCVYSIFGQQSQWIAVCWCDERGEYVEHDVFCDTSRQEQSSSLSPAAAARMWVGCLRYQRLFCGHQLLRVVLGEWQGMSQMQALAWRKYAAAWNVSRSPTGVPVQPESGIILHAVSIGINPAQGLCLSNHSSSSSIHQTINDSSSSSSQGIVDSETLANRQFSIILHGQQPRFDYKCNAMPLDETLASPCPNTTEMHAKRGGEAWWLWTTGYMALQDHHRTPAVPAKIPCFCVQLLSNAETHEAVDQKSDDARKMSLLTTRSILRQYHQLAVLRHAEHDFSASRNDVCASASGDADFGGWPASLLPLPVAVIHDIQTALVSLL
ncbi:hypothetical protein IW140_006255 [Coemansia sp. RSA 1813]|nr:hypothetical protein IW140_006255 [Coemansia sp. RSA 1813]